VRVRLSKDSLADLKAIASWIHQDNPARAASFSAELEQCCATLADQPRRFQLVRRVRGEDIRKRTHGHYLIFYRIAATQVDVLRIIHSARDWRTELGL